MKLTYFNARGMVEISRLILAQAGVDYEDIRVEKEKWSGMKNSTPFGGLPTLEVDGVTLCQSIPIARYLARKYGLHGKTEMDQAKIDMLVGCIRDAMAPGSAIFRESDPTKKEVLRKKYEEEQLPEKMAMLEKLLIANDGGDGYYVGKELTWADLCFLDFTFNPPSFEVDLHLEKYPKLKALKKRVEDAPNIAAWIANRPQTPF